jgi:CheY-specific phosphatase CheX
MEKEALITAMKGSISDVLEKMFFLPLDFSDASSPDELWNSEKGEIIVSRLDFKGPVSGYFAFSIPKDLALSLTGDLLGCDDEEMSKNNLKETVNEITNMIAGNTFSNYDDQAIFDLGIPESISFSESEKDQPASREDIFIAVNTLDNWLSLRMVCC